MQSYSFTACICIWYKCSCVRVRCKSRVAHSQQNRRNRFDCLYLPSIISTHEIIYISVQSVMQIYCHLHTIQSEWQRNERIEIKVIRQIIASIIFSLLGVGNVNAFRVAIALTLFHERILFLCLSLSFVRNKNATNDKYGSHSDDDNDDGNNNGRINININSNLQPHKICSRIICCGGEHFRSDAPWC